jgi:uncharacterized protein YegP (UPF0339 family)
MTRLFAQFHIKRHADGEWMLFRNGEIIAVLDTYAEAVERAEIEMNTIKESTDVAPPI